MKDPISIPRLQLLHPLCRDTFQAFIEHCELDLDITLRITQGLRTIAEQDALYAIGRTVKGANPTGTLPMGQIVTKAKGGQSYHNFGMAIDIIPMIAGQPQWSYKMSKLFKEIGNNYPIVCGGNFKNIKDYDHFQMEMGYTVGQLYAKYSNNDLSNGYVNV